MAALTADVALAARGDAVVDVSHRADADVPWIPQDELPFADRAVAAIALGDAAAALSLRDQVHFLAECRRVLADAACLRLIEAGREETWRALRRAAALVGFRELPATATEIAWQKRAADVEREPLVSILVPAWNPRFFAQALDSALAQTWRRLEIVICDDSEGDAIADVVASRSARFPIRYVRNASRLHARANYARCLDLAQGEYIKFLNDDDVLAPDCVRTLLSAFQSVPDVTLATSHRRVVDGRSAVADDIPATRRVVDRDSVVHGPSLANAAIMHGLNFIGEPSTVLFRRRDVEADPRIEGDGPFHFNGTRMPGIVDLPMWARLLLRGNAVFFAAPQSDFRRHGEQAQARSDVVTRSIEGLRTLQREWIRLGLFRMFPPHLLYVRPLASPDPRDEDWRLMPIPWLNPAVDSPDEAMRKWRAVRRHPFDVA